MMCVANLITSSKGHSRLIVEVAKDEARPGLDSGLVSKWYDLLKERISETRRLQMPDGNEE